MPKRQPKQYPKTQKKPFDKVSETSKKAVDTIRTTINEAKAKIAERKAAKARKEAAATEEVEDGGESTEVKE